MINNAQKYCSCSPTIGYRKNIVLVAACLFVLAAGVIAILSFSLFSSGALAAEEGSITSTTLGDTEFATIALKLFIKTDALNELTLESPMGQTVLSLGRQVGTIFSTLALMWLTVKTIMDIVKAAVYMQINFQSFLKILIKFVLTGFVIIMAGTILDAIDTAGSTFNHAVANMFDAGWSDETVQKAGQRAVNSGTIVVFAMVSIFIYDYFKVTCYIAFLEIGLRRVFAPLALLNIVSADSSGGRSPGMRFFVKYFALYLRILIILMIVFLANVIMVAATLNPQSSFVDLATDWTYFEMYPLLAAIDSFTPLLIATGATKAIADSSKIVNELFLSTGSYRQRPGTKRQ